MLAVWCRTSLGEKHSAPSLKRASGLSHAIAGPVAKQLINVYNRVSPIIHQTSARFNEPHTKTQNATMPQ